MKFTWDEIDQCFSDTFDLFICSASFEERCLSFARHCPDGRVRKALICHNKEYGNYIFKNLASMRTIFDEKNIEYGEAVLSHLDPIASVDTFIFKLNELISESHISNVLVDITAFTHEMLLIALRVFNDMYSNLQVSFVYSNAEDYDPKTSDTEPSASPKWLSKGIAEIRSVIGYPGDAQPTNNTHLLIIVGYEYDRALSIISELEPSSLSLAFGKSDSFTTEGGSNNKYYGAKEHFDELTEKALAYFPEDKFFKFEISCNAPEKTKKEIDAHLRSIGINRIQTNIVIFALNNKPSTLGVGIYAIENEDVQLCYAPALIYNYENYSKPGNYCYLFE